MANAYKRTMDVEQVWIWLNRLVLQRLVIVTILFGTTFYIHVGGEGQVFGPSLSVLWSVIGLSYFVSVIYYVLKLTLDSTDQSSVRWQVVVQILYDILLSTLLVYATGGVDSFFTPLYCVNICFAACILGKRFSYIVSGLCTLCFSIMVTLEYYGFVPHTLKTSEEIVNMQPLKVLSSIFFNMLLFSIVAIIVGYMIDRLIATQDRLQEEGKRFADLKDLNQRILENISSGIITIDELGAITSFNYAAEKIFSLSHSRVLGENVDMVLPDLKKELDELSHDNESSLPKLLQTNFAYRAQGEKEHFLSASVSSLTGDGYIIAVQDLTSYREMQEEVRRNERMAAIGRLSAGIAHEIRNPLASISGSIEMLSAEQQSDENKRLMNIAFRETERLNGIITNFLEFARPAPPNYSTFKVSEAIEDVLGLFANDSRQTKVVKNYSSDPMVNGDRDQIKQVLWNLLKNADDASKQDGHIEVGTGFNNNLGMVYIDIRDFGMGVPEEMRERIFDPFFTTKGDGFGLGLATVSKIVAGHGGQVEVLRPEGEGTVFRVLLKGEATV